MKKVVSVACMALLTIASVSYASEVVVHLRNGQKVSYPCDQVDEVVVHLRNGQKVSYPCDQVEKITFQDDHAVQESHRLKNVAASSEGGEATAQDYGTYMGNAQVPSRINDEDASTCWAGMKMPAWCKVQFDTEYHIKKVRCTAVYHTQTYQLQLSIDGQRWKTIAQHSTPDNQPSGESEGSDVYEVDVPDVPARYVRVVVTETDAPASHIYQAIIGELEAFGY